MKQRVITAVIAILILIPFLIFSDTAAFVFLACLLSVLSAYELLGCVGYRRKLYVTVPTYILAVSVSCCTRFGDSDNPTFISIVFFQYFIYIVLLFTIAVFSKGKVKFENVSVLIVMMIYATFGFSALVRLRDLPHGKLLYLMALLMPWVSDTFAYFSGRFFGRHKLIPEVSPKKTVEGAIGAIVGSRAVTVVYGIVCASFFDLSVNLFLLAVVGILISIVAQCGDLIASMVKRSYGIKDYGWILPGHGGILDRFDSIIATSSLVYIYCLSFPFFSVRIL